MQKYDVIFKYSAFVLSTVVFAGIILIPQLRERAGSIKKTTIYIVVSNPSIYLRSLLKQVAIVGIISVALCYVYIHTDLHENKIPPTMHGLIGVVIGLLLVFRTNTAYDRWWEGRKTISALSSDVGFLSAKLRTLNFRKKRYLESAMHKFIDDLAEYLKSDDTNCASSDFHSVQMKNVDVCMSHIINIPDGSDRRTVESYMAKMIEHSNILERIKNTPIPLSYKLHIKICLFAYVFTLPFGLFYDLGLWSALMVSIIYYIIAGVEIISSEIENPFAGDPNDLPIDVLFGSIKQQIYEENVSSDVGDDRDGVVR